MPRQDLNSALYLTYVAMTDETTLYSSPCLKKEAVIYTEYVILYIYLYGLLNLVS